MTDAKKRNPDGSLKVEWESSRVNMPKVRRGVVEGHYLGCTFAYDPNGTHALVPVEAWKRVVETLQAIVDCRKYRTGGGDTMFRLAASTLAEIGGGDE